MKIMLQLQSSLVQSGQSIRYAIDFPLLMMMELDAIGIINYAHHNVEEPTILIRMGFPQTQ